MCFVQVPIWGKFKQRENNKVEPHVHDSAKVCNHLRCFGDFIELLSSFYPQYKTGSVEFVEGRDQNFEQMLVLTWSRCLGRGCRVER